MEFLYIFLFIAGLVLLLKGADVITDYASRIARALGISEMVIGITLVAVATSLPELAVCVTSAFSGIAIIASGTIIGSNIANIGLVLGISALAAPFVLKAEFLRQGYIMLVFSFLFAFLLLGGMFWFEGMILIVLIIIYMVWLVKFKKREAGLKPKKSKEAIHKVKYIIFCIVGGAAVVLGGNFIVTSTVQIARWVGISEMVISLIIIAVGTSLPELATSVVAARKKMRGISLGNIIGSNIFNIMILGISSLIVASPTTTSLMLVNIPIMLILSILLVFFIKNKDMRISKKEGIAFLLIYVIFIALQFVAI